MHYYPNYTMQASNAITQLRHMVVLAEQLCWSYDKAVEILGNNVSCYNRETSHDKIICYLIKDFQTTYKIPDGIDECFNKLFNIPENEREYFCAFKGGLERILNQLPVEVTAWETVHVYIEKTYVKIAQVND